MTVLRDFLPPPGNPIRPAQILLLIFFAANLIGWNIAMPLMGMSAGSTIFLTILIAILAVICCGFVWQYGESLENQRSKLWAGEVWARWQLSPAEYELYRKRDNDSNQTVAVTLGMLGLGLGLFFIAIMADPLTGGVMAGVFLFAALFVFWAGRVPNQAASGQPLEVLVGPNGAMVGNRLLPLRGAGMHLRNVDLRYDAGTLPSLVFLVRARVANRTQLSEVRVPVPTDHIRDAEALIERFRGEPDGSGVQEIGSAN